MPQSPIRRLVLNDVGPQIPTKGLMRLSKYAGQDPEFKSIEDAKKYFKMIYAEFGDLSEEQWQKLTASSVREVSPGRFVSKLDHHVKLGVSKGQLAWQAILHPVRALEGHLFDVNLWHIWQKVTCPVLVLHGRNSDILVPEIIEKMQASHGQTEVIEIADVGHAPALHEAGHLEMIARWLSR